MTIASTKERAGEYDAIETAKPGEPLFPLQGGDPFAPGCVLHWAGLARAEAIRLMEQAAAERAKRKREKMHAEAKRLRDKANNAEEVAWVMQEYQRGDQAADEDAAPGYGGVERDAERDSIAVLSAIADRIYNSIAELTDAADGLAAIGEPHAGQADALHTLVASLQDTVTAIEPRRHLSRKESGQ